MGPLPVDSQFPAETQPFSPTMRPLLSSFDVLLVHSQLLVMPDNWSSSVRPQATTNSAQVQSRNPLAAQARPAWK